MVIACRQLDNLERSVSSDIRLILTLLTQKNNTIIPDINLVYGDSKKVFFRKSKIEKLKSLTLCFILL